MVPRILLMKFTFHFNKILRITFKRLKLGESRRQFLVTKPRRTGLSDYRIK